MPRAPRATAESGFYHVILRGNGRQIIFEDDADRRAFLELLVKRAEDAGIHVLAWCLMENHVHLVLEDPTQALSEMMQRLSGGYAQRFNRKSGRVGHVFENRFKSCPIENEDTCSRPSVTSTTIRKTPGFARRRSTHGAATASTWDPRRLPIHTLSWTCLAEPKGLLPTASPSRGVHTALIAALGFPRTRWAMLRALPWASCLPMR